RGAVSNPAAKFRSPCSVELPRNDRAAQDPPVVSAVGCPRSPGICGPVGFASRVGRRTFVGRAKSDGGAMKPRMRAEVRSKWQAGMFALLPVLLGAWPRPSVAAMLAPGDAFPSWELSDQTGAKVSSRQFAGKTYLLWFYPKAQTPGCTAEGDGLRDQFNVFSGRQVEVLGVSFDDPKSNAEFVRAEKFPFRLLSDPERTLAIAVGAADTRDQPMAPR